MAFANLDRLGNFSFNNEQNLAHVVAKAHKTHVKVYLSIAGDGKDKELAQYWLNILQLESRKNFIKEILRGDYDLGTFTSFKKRSFIVKGNPSDPNCR